MLTSKKLAMIILPSGSVMAILVYIFGSEINNFLKSNNADNILLIILISVNGLGGLLVPFLFTGSKSEIKREKLSKVFRNLT
jgi:hypothetical protein